MIFIDIAQKKKKNLKFYKEISPMNTDRFH